MKRHYAAAFWCCLGLSPLATAQSTAPVTEDPASVNPAIAEIAAAPDASATESPASAALAPINPIALESQALLVGDVLARLQARLQPGACALGGEAQDWRKRYAHNPRVFGQHVLSILPLLEFVLAETERRDLPGEFALIPIIESWYRPAAIGAGGPAGMWQMIASTARNHGVRIRAGYDGRLSPIESTHAALAYLDALQQRFGGWQPTVMAYNAGEFRLLGAMQRAGSDTVAAERGLPRGLSPITYHYVHKLQALSCLLGEAQAQGLQLPLQQRLTRLQAVEVETGIATLQRVASAVGAEATRVRELNPGFRQGRIADDAPRLVLVPLAAPVSAVASAAPTPVAHADIAKPAASDTSEAEPLRTHRVDRGETLWAIARRYGISIDALRQLNRLDLGQALRVGQRLLLPR